MHLHLFVLLTYFFRTMQSKRSREKKIVNATNIVIVKLATLLQNLMHRTLAYTHAYKVCPNWRIASRDQTTLYCKTANIGSLLHVLVRFVYCLSIRLMLSTECIEINFVLYRAHWVCFVYFTEIWVQASLFVTCATGTAVTADVHFSGSLYFTFILFNWYSECLVFFSSLSARAVFHFFLSLLPFLSRSHHFTTVSALFLSQYSEAFGCINPFIF